jgi:hypothetical protein
MPVMAVNNENQHQETGDYHRLRNPQNCQEAVMVPRFHRSQDLVGATGFEPVTSSVSDPTSPYRSVHRMG